MSDSESSPLTGIMHPGSVAFWGASANPMGMGSVLMSQLIGMGFPGPIYPIHPKETVIQGLKAYERIADVPDKADLAVLVIPTRIVPEILEECGRAGVTSVIVVSAGFGEMGKEGKSLQDRLVQIATKYGMSILGPNCIGVVNSHWQLNTTFCKYSASPGFIGMASQSGSFVTQMFAYLERFGLGFSQAISVGNEAMIDLTDCLEYLGRCSHTKVIGLYIETIRRGREFVEVAREVSRSKPIVAYYVGGSERGKQAALSHTGAMAGPDRLYDGIFKQCGIIRASSMAELYDICWVMGTQPLPQGDRLAILSHSGGPAASVSDAAERCGLSFSQFSESTRERLQALVPSTASIENPVDLTFNKNPQDYTTTLPSILLEDESVDSLFIYLLLLTDRVRQTFLEMVGDQEQAEAMAHDFIVKQCTQVSQLASKYGKPVVGGAYCSRSEQFMQELQNRGFPILSTPDRAVIALSALARYAEYRRRESTSQSSPKTFASTMAG